MSMSVLMMINDVWVMTVDDEYDMMIGLFSFFCNMTVATWVGTRYYVDRRRRTA